MAQQLVADAIIEQAHKDTGIDAFDAETYREGLDVFVEDFNDGIARGLYIEAGIQRAHDDCLHYLSNRLKVADYLRQRPELLERPIERPVFVMGMARTGTTLMSNLLAADPARRSPIHSASMPMPLRTAGRSAFTRPACASPTGPTSAPASTSRICPW